MCVMGLQLETTLKVIGRIITGNSDKTNIALLLRSSITHTSFLISFNSTEIQQLESNETNTKRSGYRLLGE